MTTFAGVVLGSALLLVLLAFGVAIDIKPEAARAVSFGLLIWLVFLVFVVSPFRIWKRTKIEVGDLNERFKPRLKLSFGKDIPGCIRDTHFTNGPRATFFRIKVEYLGTGTLMGCTGYLIDVTKGGAPIDFGESLQLTFALGEDSDATNKAIPDKVPQFLDVGFVLEDGKFGMATRGRVTPNSLARLFSEPSDYRLRVAVSSSTADVPSETIDLLLHLTGDRQTTEMEYLPGRTDYSAGAGAASSSSVVSARPALTARAPSPSNRRHRWAWRRRW
jgi:hypothetical protein